MQRFTLNALRGLAALALVHGAAAAQAAGYPAKPIVFIVPYTAGGTTDLVARTAGAKVAEKLGQPVIVENRPGAGGNIGMDAVAKAAPDGYTIGMGQAANLAINPSLYAKMPFDSLKDFTPIASVALQPVVLTVRADSPFKTLDDFIKAAKAKPGYGIAQAGNGTVGHLAGEMLARRAGIQILQVPYKGANPAMTDLLGGQVELYFGSTGSVMPQLSAGKIRALAVTSAQRVSSLPDVPTVAEQGYPDFEASTWLGLVGPAGMPADVVKRIGDATMKLLATKEVQDKLAQEGSVPTPADGAKFGAWIKSEHAKWGKLIREAHIQLN